MGQPVVHFELWSEDPANTSQFYCKVFDWRIRYMEELNYRIVETRGEDGIDGGVSQLAEGRGPERMCFYILVDSLEDYLEKIRGAGGKTIVERQEVPNAGAWFYRVVTTRTCHQHLPDQELLAAVAGS